MRCLFITHKWGDAVPNSGESVTVPHLIDTFHEWGKGRAYVIWTDECFHNKRDISRQLNAAKADFRPDVMLFTPIPADALEPQNVSPELMRQAGCTVVSVFFDLADPAARRRSQKYAAGSDLCVGIDGDQTPIGACFLSLWPVRTRRASCPKTIDVCFVGARRNYPDRTTALRRLENEGIKVKILGGRDEQRCTFHEYMEILDDSLIALNFSKTPSGSSQIKARVFEALSAHCCLVEDRNPVTERYLTPGVDYVAWDQIDDFVSVVRSLIADRGNALRIAKSGHATFEAKYNSARFWDEMAAAVEIASNRTREKPLGRWPSFRRRSSA